MKVNYTEPFSFHPIPTITPASSYWENGTWKFNLPEITPNTASTPSYVDIILHGVTALTLVNAKEDGLNYLKLFGGCEQRNLPSGYTQLEYIQSDGASYLIVPYRVNNKTVFYCRYNEVQNGPQTANAIFGVTNAPDVSRANDGILRLTGSSFDRVGWGDNTPGSIIDVPTAPKVFDTWYEVLYDQNELYQDGTLYATSATDTSTVWSANYDLGIFARNSSSVTMFSVVKISSVWAKEDGEYKINLVPAKRNSDNVLGMYDLVSGQFLTNQGTGTFTAGTDSVPTPDTPIDIVCNNGTIKARHQSGLPLGYTLLDYVVFDSTQVIDTGFIPDNNSRIESKCYRTGDDCWFYGASPSNPRITLYHSRTGTCRWGNQSISNSGFVADTEYTIIEDKNGLNINGVDNPWTSGTADDFTCDRSLTIGNNNGSSGTRYFAGNFYYMKIYNNGVLVRDFVPCQNALNVVGLYDSVNGVFYTDTGLVAGNPVNDLEIYIDGTVETVKDSLNNTATAEMLLSVGDVKDVQSVLDGEVTRNIGILILDGTEGWLVASGTGFRQFYSSSTQGVIANSVSLISNIAPYGCTASTRADYDFGCYSGGTGNLCFQMIGSSTLNTTSDFSTYLSTQYAQGTPVIIVYPLAESTTESVTAQPLTTQAGTNIVEITQASMDNLELEVSYKAGVAVTITEIENAQLDNSVEVTIQ